MRRSPDDIAQDIQDARMAALVLEQLRFYVDLLSKQILDNSLVLLKQGSLTPQQAFGTISEIAGLRRLEQHLEAKVKRSGLFEKELENG